MSPWLRLTGQSPGEGGASETWKSQDLPKVPQPLYGEGPHTAPGATAVLVRAASVGERAQAVSFLQKRGRTSEEVQADFSVRTELPPLHFTKLAERWWPKQKALRGTASFKASVCYTSPWAESQWFPSGEAL